MSSTGGRLLLERAGAVQHVVSIDRLNVGHVGQSVASRMSILDRFPSIATSQDRHKPPCVTTVEIGSMQLCNFSSLEW